MVVRENGGAGAGESESGVSGSSGSSGVSSSRSQSRIKNNMYNIIKIYYAMKCTLNIDKFMLINLNFHLHNPGIQ